jgi:hypothetical protein
LSAVEDLTRRIAVRLLRRFKLRQGMHECLVVEMVLKQQMLDDADGAFSQAVACGLVRGRVVDNDVPVLGPVLELCSETRSVVALYFPWPPEKVEHFLHVPDD